MTHNIFRAWGNGAGLSDTAADEALLAACLRGEQDAWDELIGRYAALIWSIPLKFGLGEADAADVFQAVCITLLERLGSIRAPQGLTAWIMTTTRRECLGLIRKQRRRSSETTLDPSTEPADPELPADEELAALERQHALKLAVSQLSSPCRELIEALFSDSAERQSYAQLARRLKLSPNSLGPTRARCLERLRRLLDASGYRRLYE